MIMRRPNLFILGILCLFIIVSVAAAEADDTFNTYGQVTDANGNQLPGATATMVNFAYKTVASTTTDANGNFAFKNVSTDNRLVKVIISYTDKNGNTYRIPPEFSMWFMANGNVYLNKDSTQLTDYPPADISTHASRLAINPVIFPMTKPPAQMPLNVNAFALALALGVILLAGIFLILRRIL
jgi:hypothetical protein